MHDILDIVMINTIRMDDILSISNLHKHYVRNGFFGKKLPPVKAVDGISFSIKPGNVLVLAGESGSGKSTIARLILGAEEADSGTIRFGGNKVDYATGDGVGEIRAGCQMVHQNPYDSVNPRMHVSDIIAEYTTGKEIKKKGFFRCYANTHHWNLTQLSGGQKTSTLPGFIEKEIPSTAFTGGSFFPKKPFLT